MFPTSIEGTIPISNLTPEAAEAALSQLELAFVGVNAYDLAVQGGRVSFRSGGLRGFFSMGGWNVLGPVDRGWVEITDGRVRYHFRTVEALAVTCAMGLAGGLLTVLAGGPIPAGLLIVGVVLLWLFGGNYVIAVWRLRAFVKRAIGPAVTAASGSGPSVCPKCGALYDPQDYRSDAQATCARCHSTLPMPQSRA